jgi:iron(II)-dependent oxidoreductase
MFPGLKAADFELLVMEGDNQGEKYPLSEKTVTVGRKLPYDTRQNFILIMDKTSTVSTVQADIEWVNNSHMIKPRKTTNPTKVNDIEISDGHSLSPGDKIHMGRVVLLYQEIAEPTLSSTIDEKDIPLLRSLAFKETVPGRIEYFCDEPAVRPAVPSLPHESVSIQEGSVLPDYSHKYLFDGDEEDVPLEEEIIKPPSAITDDEEATDISHDQKTIFNDIPNVYDYELEIIKGDRKGEIFPLDKKEFLIGRMSKKSPTARDLLFPLQDRTISREHARLSTEGREVYLVNESKKSITLLNEIQVTDKEKLKHGDLIQIGEHIVLLFRKKEELFLELDEEDSTVVPMIKGLPVITDLPSSPVVEAFIEEVPLTGQEVSSHVLLTDISPEPDLMVLIEEGPFWMGNDEVISSSPVHEAVTKSYYIDIYPVTNSDYRNFIEATGYKSEGRWENSFRPGKEEHPAVNVTFNDAMSYADWAGKRLPDEAEWEKAARGNDRRLYPWGNDWDMEKLNSRENNFNGTMSVHNCIAGKSPYGIMNMTGNTWEWTHSPCRPYCDSNLSKPAGKVLRGGSWLNNLKTAGCTLRYEAWIDESGPDTGFRCVRDL